MPKRIIQLSIPIVLLFFICCNNSVPAEIKSAYTNLPDKIDFNYHIKPILSDRCFKCHGPDENKRKADFRIDLASFAFAETTAEHSVAKFNLVPNKLNASEVFNRIISEESEYMMPPNDSNLSLSTEEKALIAKWIEQGAEFKTHWSFVPPQKSKIPEVKNSKWTKQDLDYFILDKIERKGLSPSEEANKVTLLRRITLDLTGLPPTPEEIDLFLNDLSPNSYEIAIDRLLKKPQYGEKMAAEWLDVARYADSHGYQDDGMRNTWPWRDWVIESFNKNMHYDQFVTEQLAGDLIPNATKDQILATCFNRNHPQSQEGGVVEEEYRVEYVTDRTNTFGKALLGITLECAKCHDHKYDPFSQKEYYALSAFFNNNNDSGIVPYNGEASPTIMLPTNKEKQILAGLNCEIETLELEILPENYLSELELWLESNTLEVDLNEGLVASFDFEKEVEADPALLNLDNKKSPGWAGIGGKNKVVSYINKAKNKPDAAILGDKDRRPLLKEGKVGNGIQFRGDCGLRFNRDMDYDRDQPFSVSIWVKLLKSGEKGPIFNNTNGDFEGYRGWICKLNEDGTLSFQLNHVWPDNAIDYQTIEKLPVGEWTHIVMSYNGNSKADGLKFYINGKVPEYKLHRDNLHKSLLHGVKGSNWSSYPFMLGKEKERSIENIIMDELLVYNRKLSEIEVQKIFDQANQLPNNKEQILDFYLSSGKNQRFNRNFEKLSEFRKEQNLIETDVLEVMVMHDMKEKRPTYILDRGMYDAHGEEVEPNTPAILSNMPDGFSKNRLGLANWVISKENPLTARVEVNRIWKMLFGKGLVSTQEDFGNQGALPSHGELLDYLAVDFMENGWDIKLFIKKILLSATYQQQSIPSENSKKIDPVNEFYSYYPSYRLPAEIIRDNAIAASGLLAPKIGGPSVYPYQPNGIWEALATRNATEYKQGKGEDLYRRSLYTIWKRSAPPPSMMNFDTPDRYNCTVSRQKTSTPLQSLVLMNDPQYVEASRVLSEKATKLGFDSIEKSINYIFKSLIGRDIEKEELILLAGLYEKELDYFDKNGKRAIELLRVGDQAVDENLDKKNLAALTMVASTIINFDEFVRKQ